MRSVKRSARKGNTAATATESERALGIDRWTIAAAKARFSKLLDQVRSKGRQAITEHGRTPAVVASVEEWERKSKRLGSLAEFFAGSPLRKSGIEVKRGKDRPRKAGL